VRCQICRAKLAQRIGQSGHDAGVAWLEAGKPSEQVQRIDTFGRAKLRADEHVARRGADVAVSHQPLDRDQIDTAFEQVGGKGVTTMSLER